MSIIKVDYGELTGGGTPKWYIIGGMASGAGAYGCCAFATDDIFIPWFSNVAKEVYEDENIKFVSLAQGDYSGTGTITYKKNVKVSDGTIEGEGSFIDKTAGTSETLNFQGHWLKIIPQ